MAPGKPNPCTSSVAVKLDILKSFRQYSESCFFTLEQARSFPDLLSEDFWLERMRTRSTIHIAHGCTSDCFNLLWFFTNSSWNVPVSHAREVTVSLLKNVNHLHQILVAKITGNLGYTENASILTTWCIHEIPPSCAFAHSENPCVNRRNLKCYGHRASVVRTRVWLSSPVFMPEACIIKQWCHCAGFGAKVANSKHTCVHSFSCPFGLLVL